MFELDNFDAIQIGLASPSQIREQSKKEARRPEAINYRTLKPERDGLFCERIFGSIKDWECHCGKYKRVRYRGIVYDECEVEVTKAKVRRERMGRTELAAPVSHIWYFKGIPSRMGLLLDMPPRILKKILYFASYVVTDPKEIPLLKKQLLNEKEYREAVDKYDEESFIAGMGAEAVQELLEEINLEGQPKEFKEELKTSAGREKVRIIRRLRIIKSFRKSGSGSRWMVVNVIPVVPSGLRPMVQLDGERFATSDLNDLYRRVINRNNRLKKLLDLGAPDIIVRNEKRMLQEAVDALIDNGKRRRPVTGPGNKPLKSLSDMFRDEQGRSRQNLLGKRVGYSGRSVIVVSPELKMHRCGFPKEMALELFKPFVMKKLVEDRVVHNIKSARGMVERINNQVWDVLGEAITDHPVLLDRAPTLHRLGIQVLQPVLVENRAMGLHPLVCTAYNTDFDGDQMAVHVPSSVRAQAEARFLVLAAGNITKPSNGKPVYVPTQDMVLGSYYLTMDKVGARGEGKVFASEGKAITAYEVREIATHTRINVRIFKNVNDEKKPGIIKATVDKPIFNESIPQDLGFVDRDNKDEEFDLEVDSLITKKSLGKIINKCYAVHGPTNTSVMLDKIKALGYHYSSIGAVTVATSNMIVPEAKYRLLKEANGAVGKIEKVYKRGFISEEEKYKRVIEKQTKTTEDVADAFMNSLGEFSPVFVMTDSGARGSKSQIKRLAGMRELMTGPTGEITELPIRASFRGGPEVVEHFISAHGARKGSADAALETADPGYLTRRLVDVSQDVIVKEIDCGTTGDIYVSEIKEGSEAVEGLAEGLYGRYTAEPIIHSETSKVMAEADQYMEFDVAEKVTAASVRKVKIRSVFTYKCKVNVCPKCYGVDMATAQKVNIGEAVGIIAARSIGESGTQLIMRTFHTGGAIGADITQGLSRVEELFKARRPKGLAIVSKIIGTVRVEETKKKRTVFVMANGEEERSYEIPLGPGLKVSGDDLVEAEGEITEGSVNPHNIATIKDIDGARKYLLSEVQKVCRLQGVDINDEHSEVVVRRMTRKIRVLDSGDTELLPGAMIDIFDFEEKNARVGEFGREEAKGEQALPGITKAALATDSFLSAASFQGTARVLTEAVIKGKIDPLVGLKGDVIISKLIPTGTGVVRYRNIKLDVEDVLVEDDALESIE